MKNNLKSSKILLSLIITLCLFLSSSACVSGTQLIEEIDSTSINSKEQSIAIDNINGIHICYGDSAGNMIYAMRTDDGWNQTIVEKIGNNQFDISLALDIDGNPHMSYIVEDIGLKYAVWTGTEWIITVIEHIEMGFTSLAVDSEGHSHISYSDWTNNALKYAWWTGSTWQIETVESLDNDSSIWCSPLIDIDSEDNPHITYSFEAGDVAGTDGDEIVRYASRNHNSWNVETIPSDNYRLVSFRLDANDRPNVILWHGALRYALKSDEGWEIEPIPSVISSEPYFSLVINSRNELNIYYNDEEPGTIKSATRVRGEWQIKDIHTFSNSPPVTLVNIVHATDSNDNYHILINDWVFSRLFYVYDDNSSGNSFPILQIAGIVLIVIAIPSAAVIYRYRRRKAKGESPPAPGDGPQTEPHDNRP